MKKIQVLKPYYRIDECLQQIKECLDIGWTGMGFKTVDFEEKWKEYTRLPYAHFLNSATAGLHLAIKVLKEDNFWYDDDEIITTPFTFVSTNHAIKYENLTPVFADIDDSLNLNPDSVKDKITSRTRAIMFVGVGGNTANLMNIIKLAKENNLKIILDASHMTGSRIENRHVGFDVDASVFSFQAVKNLPTADSGMICFSNKELDQKARCLSWLGIDKDTFQRSNQGTYKWDYDVARVGYKYHGNSIMAALGLVGLKYVEEDNAYRNKLAEKYMLNFGNKIRYILHKEGSSRHIFQIVVENRDEVIDFLYNNGIYPGVHYKDNMQYKMYHGDFLENSQYFSKRVLSLPLHLNLTLDDIDYISTKILEIVK
ncbi:DegT/DnrJ/EryC1/StrS family aminotransferase [Campylobacter curvus]|uniref:Aminotransferase, DegT/DnrJ/EryC1/StrS family n=1 Tax=Campylobacter curvus (strain 525.92) TaxID=360105 RepID=A7GZ39_CAMC5|nr:DegT/DnrJ/EryC1/StrS family aminotransferase [Campylobacter curvus]EAU00061.1 aminotransferase, DegT/DnrJ/EryC1/StrS family [Campylobacter curvus 525.92]